MTSRFVLRALNAGILASICFAGSPSVWAGAATGGSTEVTQLMNNAELLAIAATEAEAVAEAIERRLIQVNQYITMAQNLKNLPSALMAKTLAPYQQQINALGRVYQAVTSLKQTTDTARNLFSQRLGEAGSMKMNVADYMRHEAALANQRGGIYRQRLQQDLAAIDQLQSRATALREVAEQTRQITGNVEGLQVLSQHASITAGELMEIKGVLLAQSADRNAQSALKQEASADKSNTMSRTLNEAKAQKDSRSNQGLSNNNLWGNPWPGMTSQ